MFGYVQVRKAELKVKDYELYHSFYCGLCHALKDGHGLKGQITLTYDCTFLVMLLSSLYELDVEKSMSRCIVHPAKKHAMSVTDASRYCADMNVLLSWYHFKDDREDDERKMRGGPVDLFDVLRRLADVVLARKLRRGGHAALEERTEKVIVPVEKGQDEDDDKGECDDDDVVNEAGMSGCGSGFC